MFIVLSSFFFHFQFSEYDFIVSHKLIIIVVITGGKQWHDNNEKFQSEMPV